MFPENSQNWSGNNTHVVQSHIMLELKSLVVCPNILRLLPCFLICLSEEMWLIAGYTVGAYKYKEKIVIFKWPINKLVPNMICTDAYKSLLLNDSNCDVNYNFVLKNQF